MSAKIRSIFSGERNSGTEFPLRKNSSLNILAELAKEYCLSGTMIAKQPDSDFCPLLSPAKSISSQTISSVSKHEIHEEKESNDVPESSSFNDLIIQPKSNEQDLLAKNHSLSQSPLSPSLKFTANSTDIPSAFRPVPQYKEKASMLSILSKFSPQTAVDTPVEVKQEHQKTGKFTIKLSIKKLKYSCVKHEQNEQFCMKVKQQKEENLIKCDLCQKKFSTGQALGGHMSRMHSGKSEKYFYKQTVRKMREFERMKLILAKQKFFRSLNLDYKSLTATVEGRITAKSLINRSKIKMIKSKLTEEEINNFIDSQ